MMKLNKHKQHTSPHDHNMYIIIKLNKQRVQRLELNIVNTYIEYKA